MNSKLTDNFLFSFKKTPREDRSVLQQKLRLQYDR